MSFIKKRKKLIISIVVLLAILFVPIIPDKRCLAIAAVRGGHGGIFCTTNWNSIGSLFVSYIANAFTPHTFIKIK